MRPTTLLPLAISLAPALGQEARPAMPQDLPAADRPQAAAALPATAEVTLFDVSDLVDPAPPKALEPLLLQDRNRRLEQTGRLAEVLRAKAPGGLVLATSAAAPGILRVEADAAGLAWAEDFVAAQRRHPDPVIITVHLLEVPKGGLWDLGIQGSSALFEEPGTHAAFLERVRASDEATLLSAPHLAVSPREHATMSTLNQVAYVADYELRLVEPEQVEILDPIVDVIEEGTTLAFDAVPMPDGVYELDVEVTYAELERPIPTIKRRFSAGGAREVEVGLPEVETVRLRSLLALRPGTAALFASAAPDADRDFAVVLHLGLPPRATDPVVDELFRSMRAGTYAHRWFPPLPWSAVPDLVARGSATSQLEHFPRNPFSSQAQARASEGLIALWLVEGLCEGGHYGSLSPLLVEQGRPLDPTLAHQLRLQERAAAAYARWWSRVATLDHEAARSIDPLEDSELAWYGSVRR